MSATTHVSFEPRPLSFPGVKPRWLRPIAIAAAISLHAFVAWYSLRPGAQHFTAIDVTLVPSGDPHGWLDGEFGEQDAADALPPPLMAEEDEQSDIAAVPPAIMSPEALPLPRERKESANPKPRAQKNKEARKTARAGIGSGSGTGAGTGSGTGKSGRRPFGLPEGQAAATGRVEYAALIAVAIRRHTPATTSIGAGSAHVSFRVNAAGAVIGVSASGSSPAHAQLARRIVGSVHAPPPPGGSFFGAQDFYFQ
jgi:protein TonB